LGKDRLLSCSILAGATVAKESSSYPDGLLQSCGTKSLIAFSAARISRFSLSTVRDSVVAPLGQPVASYAPGLTSSGDPLLLDADSDKDGILHIFSSVICERQKNGSEASLLKWSHPMRRFWLCQTFVGDTKETFVEEEKQNRGFGDSDEVAGGAASEVICDLNHESLIGLAPFRITRCQGRKVCAILFRHSLGLNSDVDKAISSKAAAIVLVDYSSDKAAIKVVEGRDILFFPNTGGPDVRGLVLNIDGSSLTFFICESLKTFKLASSFRPIVGVDCDKDYIECHRVVAFAEGDKLTLAVLGKRWRD
jgi:hypothetical protein